jgi:hypothetical protein
VVKLRGQISFIPSATFNLEDIGNHRDVGAMPQKLPMGDPIVCLETGGLPVAVDAPNILQPAVTPVKGGPYILDLITDL